MQKGFSEILKYITQIPDNLSSSFAHYLSAVATHEVMRDEPVSVANFNNMLAQVVSEINSELQDKFGRKIEIEGVQNSVEETGRVRYGFHFVAPGNRHIALASGASGTNFLYVWMGKQTGAKEFYSSNVYQEDAKKRIREALEFYLQNKNECSLYWK